MLAVLVGICLAGTAFCIRFLIALQRECHRSLICYGMRLESEAEQLTLLRPPQSVRARAQAAGKVNYV